MTDEEKKQQQIAEDEENDESEEEDEDESLEGDDEEEDESSENSGEEDEDEDGSDEDEEDESSDSDLTEKDLEDPEKRKLVVAKLKKAKSDAVQRAIWKKRALKAGYKKGQEPSAPAPKSKKPSSNAEILHSNERNEFRLDHPEIPRRMVDEIEIHARAKGVSLEKALRSPLIQKFVNDKELKKRLASASPSSRHRSPQTAPAKDWSKASPEEVAAHAAEVRRRKSG